MNKDRRDKKQKKKKTEDSAINELVIKNNVNNSYDYLSTFKMEDYLNEGKRDLNTSDEKRKDQSGTSNNGEGSKYEYDKVNLDTISKVIEEISTLCDSI